MTVSSSTTRADYNGNGATVSFSVPFYFIDNSHVKIVKTNLSTGTTATLALGADYSLSGAGVATGGTAALTVAPQNYEKLTIYRAVPFTQTYHYVTGDTFPAAAHETNLDLLCMESQQLNEALGRTLVLPVQVTGVSTSLPVPVANNLIGWNATATALQNIDASTLATIVAFGTAKADIFTGDGATKTFTLSVNPGSQANLDVSLGGVTQLNGVDFTWSGGTTLTFTAAPPNGVKILVRYQQALPQGYTDAASTTYKSTFSNSQTITQAVKNAGVVDLRDWGVQYSGLDETATVQQAIAGIGSSAVTLVVSGPVKVSSGLTFGVNTELRFDGGGKIIGSSGAELIQVQKQILAGRHPIFSTCSPRATTAMEVYPEWFGAVKDGSTSDSAAAIAANAFLVNTGGTVNWAPGIYALASTVGSFASGIIWRGAGMGATVLKVTSANTNGIQVLGTNVNTKLAKPVLQDFSLRMAAPASSACFGIDLQWNAFAKIERVEVADFLYGIRLQDSSNTIVRGTLATYQGTTTGFIAYIIYAANSWPANASSIFDHCSYNGNANISNAYAASSIGFKIYGNYLSDLEFLSPQGTQTAYGMYFDGSGAGAYTQDVTIINPVIDQFLNQGIYFGSLGASTAYTVSGGWINAKNTGAETDCILISGSNNITLCGGLQLMAYNNSGQGYGVKIASSNNITVDPTVSFQALKYGIYGTSTSYCRFSGSFYNNAAPAATAYISLTGDARGMVNNAVFNGYATQAVIIDATSSGSGIVGCAANIANITTRFTNNASGAIGGANGGAGLNSGI